MRLEIAYFESIELVKKQCEERYGSACAAVALNPESRAKVHAALSRIRKGDSEPVLKLLRKNTELANELSKKEVNS